MRKVVLALSFAFTLSQSASAALIDNGTYLTDTASGLDWLKLTQTINKSYNDVASQLAEGGEFAGWHYATGGQFESLLFGRGVAADVGCSPGISFCGGVTPANAPAIDSLVNLIGDTFEQSQQQVLTSESWASLGLLADPVSDLASHYVGLFVGSYSGGSYAKTHYTSSQDHIHEGHIGSFLVKTSVVPVPAAGYLFVSALAGLIGRKRFFATHS